MLVAHRGASGLAPENTLPAFDLAVKQQADAIECDVRLTADRVPVVFHDDTLQRIAGRPERIADLTLADLRQVDVGLWKGCKWTGSRVPTLDEAFAWSATGLPLVVEVKASDDPELLTMSVLASLQRVPGARLLTFSSFSIDILTMLHRLAPDLPRALITSTMEGAEDRARSVGAAAIHVAASSIQPPFPGLPLGAWTVDAPAEASRLVELGVTMIFSNRPCDLRNVVPVA